MHDFAAARLMMGQRFTRDDAVAWFHDNYPALSANTVGLHLRGMSTNVATRGNNHAHIRAGEGWDLFFKLSPNEYRLYDAATDPPPVYRSTPSEDDTDTAPDALEDDGKAGTSEFAMESHLRDYLCKHLEVVEPGLRLSEETEGVEFNAGGRFIDILANAANGDFVVIELKVSKGYDRALGQILRYIGWVRANLAEGKRVRGVIIAIKISEDLKLAASCIPDITLREYALSFTTSPVDLNVSGT